MDRTWKSSLLLVGCLTLALASPGTAQEIANLPKIEGESFAGHHVVFPEAAAGKIAILVFGFSKASKGPTGDWAGRISKDFKSDSALVLYQLPVLEDVPRLIRGMVTSGIRKGVPEADRDRFVPILNGEAELKKLVSYKDPDDAYLVVLNRSGKIVEQVHGPFTEAAYSQLRSQLQPLINGSK